MGMFQKLYDIERKAKEDKLRPEQRHALRLDESLPLLNELGKWIVETYNTNYILFCAK
jgi:transposase